MSATGVQPPPSPTNLMTTASSENNLQPSSAPGENNHVARIQTDASAVNAAASVKTTCLSELPETNMFSNTEKKAPDKENKVNGQPNGSETIEDETDADGKGEDQLSENTTQDIVNKKDNVVLLSVNLNINGNASDNLIEKNGVNDKLECNGLSVNNDKTIAADAMEKTRAVENLVTGAEDDNAVDMDILNQEKEGDKFKEDLSTPKEIVENDPNFAVICSFLEKFGPQLDIQYSILHLKKVFEDFTTVPQYLIDLHIKLLRKRKKYINKDRWESALVKFCCEYSKVDSHDLEHFGYKNANLALRLRIFLRLLETQFDFNQKFKSEVNSNNQADSLRLESFGRDITGFSYWYQSDADHTFRLYKEEPDEDGSWSLVCKNLPELHELIDDLQSKSTLDLKIESVSNSDDDGSNIASLLKANKEVKVEEEEEEELEPEEEDQDEVDEDEENRRTQIKDSKLASPIEVKREDEETVIPIDSIKIEPKEEKFESMQSIDDESNETQVKVVCESLVNQVEENDEDDGEENDNEDDEENDNLNKQVSNNSRNKRKRKRKRGGYSWGKKRARTTANRKSKEIEILSTEKIEPEQPKPEVEEKKDEKKRGRKRRTELDKLAEDISADLIEKRSSRRIQVLQEKKQKEIEEEMKRREREAQEKKRKLEAAKAAKKAAYLAAINEKIHQAELEKKSRKQRKKKGKVEESEEEVPESAEEEEEEEEDSRTAGKKRKKRRRGKGKRKRGNNPWEDSEDEEEDEFHHIEEDFDEYEIEDEVLNFDDKNDEDWFACEEIDPEDEPVVVRRARTVKKSKDDYDPNEEVVNDDKPCGRCGKYDNPHWILLCDSCDIGFHTACLRPPLFIIPTGDWFCPPCEHKKLTEKVIQVYDSLTEALELKAREAIKKSKRWKFGTQCDIAMENILNEDEERETLDANQMEGDEIGGSSEQRKSSKKGRARAQKKTRTIKDEIDELLDGYGDEFLDRNDEEEVSRDRKRKIRRIESESETDELESDLEEESNSDYSQDDIDIALEGDHSQHHKVKKTKKAINIEDYSRSGLKLRAARRRKAITYDFKEFDDMINSAIIDEEYQDEEVYEDEMAEDEEREAAGLPRSIGKDMSNILRAEMPDFSINPFDSTSSNKNAADDSVERKKAEEVAVNEDQLEIKKDATRNEEKGSSMTKKQKKDSLKMKGKKKRSLTQLDLSTDDEVDHASDEDFRMADDDDEDDEDELTEVEDDENDNTEEGSDDEYCISTSRRRSSRVSRRPARFGSKKKNKNKGNKFKSSRRRDTDDEDDDDDETEMSEDEDEEEMSDQSSDFEPRGKRRAAKKFSYFEDSSSSETPLHFGSRKSKKTQKGKYEKDEAYSEEEEEEETLKKNNRRKSKNIAHIEDEDEEEEKDFDKSILISIDKRNKGADLKTYSKKIEKPAEKVESEKVVEKIDETKNVPTTTISESTKVSTCSKTAVTTTTSSVSQASYQNPMATTSSSVDPINSMKQMNCQLEFDRPAAVPPVSQVSSVPLATSVPATSYSQPPPQQTVVPATVSTVAPTVVNPLPAPYHYHHPGVPPAPPPPQPYHYSPQAYPPPSSSYGNLSSHHPPPYRTPAPPATGYVYGTPPGSGYVGAPPPSPHYAYPSTPPGVTYAYPPPPPPQHVAPGPNQYTHTPQPHPAPSTQSPIKSDGYTLTNLDTPPSPYRVPPPAVAVPLTSQPPPEATPPPTHYVQPPTPQQPYYAPGLPPPSYDAVRYPGPPPPPHSSPSNAFHSPYPSIPPHHSGYSPQRQPMPGTPLSPYTSYPPPGQYVGPNGGFMIQNLLVQQQQQQQVPKATKSGPVATKSGPVASYPTTSLPSTLPSAPGPSQTPSASKSKKVKKSSNGGEPKKSKPKKSSTEKSSTEGTNTN